MSAKVSRDFVFNTAVHFEGIFIINSYEINLTMLVNTEDNREQNIALERIKYLINECLENSIFVNAKETKTIDLYLKAGLKVCPLPDDPFDQIVGAVLLQKFNVITEQKLYVTEIDIKSAICDDVKFYLSADDEIDFFQNENVWWNDNSASIFDYTKKSKKEKIVELKKEVTDWNLIGLSWKEKRKSNKDNGEIVFIPVDK